METAGDANAPASSHPHFKVPPPDIRHPECTGFEQFPMLRLFCLG